MLADATAARVAQADQKGWKEFFKEVEKSIGSLVLPKSDTKKPLKADAQMAGFFKSLARAKGRNQVK